MSNTKKPYSVKVSVRVEVLAESAEEAVMMASEQGHDEIHFVESENEDCKYLIGYCGFSGRPIFDGDDYWEDSEGNMTLSSEYSLEDYRRELEDIARL